MNNDERKLIRQIIRQVHPDLFVNNPYERQCNSESLKSLNSFVDELSKGGSPKSVRLEFFIRDGSGLKRLEAALTSNGSLAPLFYAFGLISAEELARASTMSSPADTNFLLWLREQVQDAMRTAEKHDVLKWHIRRLRSSLEEKYNLSGVQVGAEYAVSVAEQERQAEALKVLEAGMSTVALKRGSAGYFEGITVQLYHPELCPQETYSYVDDEGDFNMRTSYMKSYIGDDGAVHLVADKHTITEQLMLVDVDRARMLTQVSFFWQRRVRELTPAVTQVLGVRSVWCDTKNEANSQKFVLWAGYLLERREEIMERLGGRKYAFSVIVHSDTGGGNTPMINFHQSSPILNIRSDCPPSHLIEFLVSEGGEQASLAANEAHNVRAKEEALLERVRQVFEAKCVIKICMNDKVLEGAQQLLDHADTIKQAVDLKGACIALDDCYEVWDSGFISIPYNFKIQELSNMVKMLQAGRKNGEGAAGGAGNASAGPVPPSPTAVNNGSNGRVNSAVTGIENNATNNGSSSSSNGATSNGKGVSNGAGPVHASVKSSVSASKSGSESDSEGPTPPPAPKARRKRSKVMASAVPEDDRLASLANVLRPRPSRDVKAQAVAAVSSYCGTNSRVMVSRAPVMKPASVFVRSHVVNMPATARTARSAPMLSRRLF